MPKLNSLVADLSLPRVPSVLAWARAYEGGRGPLIDLSQAVPGYPAHPDMFAWLSEFAGQRAYMSYGAIEGEDVLRGEYAAHVSELYGAEISAANIHITAGANQAFMCLAMALAGTGDTIAPDRALLFQPAIDAGHAGHRHQDNRLRSRQFIPA